MGCLLWVKGCHSHYVGITSAVPQVADDLLHGTKSSESGHEDTFAPSPRSLT
jgi:hypothetical protein